MAEAASGAEGAAKKCLNSSTETRRSTEWPLSGAAFAVATSKAARLALSAQRSCLAVAGWGGGEMSSYEIIKALEETNAALEADLAELEWQRQKAAAERDGLQADLNRFWLDLKGVQAQLVAEAESQPLHAVGLRYAAQRLDEFIASLPAELSQMEGGNGKA